MDVTINCPTAPSFLSEAHVRRETAVSRKFQKIYKSEQAVHRQQDLLGSRPDFTPPVRETFGFFCAKSHSWLCKMLINAPLDRDDMLKERSWTLWRTTGSVFERVFRQLSLAVSVDSSRGPAVEL